jgi:excisionase family DNA binding protein
MTEGDTYVGIAEAAKALHKSPDTIRRWVAKGKLEAHKVATEHGEVWQIKLPHNVKSPPADMHTEKGSKANLPNAEYITSLLDRIKSLETELESRRNEVMQLHSLLNTKALPAPLPWYKRLFK